MTLSYKITNDLEHKKFLVWIPGVVGFIGLITNYFNLVFLVKL